MIANKKLNVRYHVVTSSSSTSSSNTAIATTTTDHHPTSSTNGTTPIIQNRSTITVSTAVTTPRAETISNMTKEQVVYELQNLQRKYDELIAFSVNLTAERDMISNTLEVTKRDYKLLQQQRYNNSSSNNKSKNNQPGTTTTTTKTTSSSTTRFLSWILWIGIFLFASVVSISFGIYIEQQQQSSSNVVVPSMIQPYLQRMVQIISSIMTNIIHPTTTNDTIHDTTPSTTDEL
jgi:hypothetical protein